MRGADARHDPSAPDPGSPEPGRWDPRRGDPGRGEPGPGPNFGDPAPWLDERMFDRRIVLVRGRLDAPLAGQVAAALLGLDLSGPAPIQLYLSTAEGELAAAFTIADAIGAVAAPVHAVVTGESGGAALAVLAAADRRLAFGHARLRLVEPRAAAVAGTADEVAAAAGRYLRELDELVVRLAEVTGQTRSRIESDLDARRILSATEAREYGLIDEVLGGRSGT